MTGLTNDKHLLLIIKIGLQYLITPYYNRWSVRMSLNLSSKVKMLFTTLVNIFFIGGYPPDNTITSDPPDPTGTDFSGTYQIYEELKNCTEPNCYNIVGYDSYDAIIEQTDNQAQLTPK
jgi:hypothetical protein